MVVIYECKKCAYCTYDKSKYERHCKSLKHLGIEKRCIHEYQIGIKKGLVCNKPCRGEYCKIHSDSQKRFYEKNKTKILACRKEWAIKNKERVLNNNHKYYQENKETLLQKQKTYYQKNKDKVNERTSKYYYSKKATDLDFIIYEKIRGLRKTDILFKRNFENDKYITIDWVKNELEKNNCRCSYCWNYLEIFYVDRYSQDQMSIDRIDNSKPHEIDNCLVCCLRCNLKKGKNDWSEKLDKFSNV